MATYYLVTAHQVTRIRRLRRRTYAGPGWAIVRVGQGSRGIDPDELEGEFLAAWLSCYRHAG